jgi:hypothetical protein
MRENELDSLTDQVRQDGFCILRNHLPRDLMQDCNKAFTPILRDYLVQHDKEPNRGLRRHYIPLPLEPPFYDAPSPARRSTALSHVCSAPMLSTPNSPPTPHCAVRSTKPCTPISGHSLSKTPTYHTRPHSSPSTSLLQTSGS